VNNPIVIRGYAGVFNRIVRTSELAAFVLPRGAFTPAGGDVEVPLLLDHDPSERIGTVRIWGDNFGLAFEGEFTGDHIEDAIRSGRLTECSCLYQEKRGHDGHFAGEAVRYFDRADIAEVSLVPVGGCPDTGAWVRDTPRQQMSNRQRYPADMWAMNAFTPRSLATSASLHPTVRKGGAAQHGLRPSAARPRVPASVLAVLAMATDRGLVE
jgi:HK97 family phage prohead protease